jgi:hypothetical protein
VQLHKWPHRSVSGRGDSGPPSMVMMPQRERVRSSPQGRGSPQNVSIVGGRGTAPVGWGGRQDVRCAQVDERWEGCRWVLFAHLQLDFKKVTLCVLMWSIHSTEHLVKSIKEQNLEIEYECTIELFGLGTTSSSNTSKSYNGHLLITMKGTDTWHWPCSTCTRRYSNQTLQKTITKNLSFITESIAGEEGVMRIKRRQRQANGWLLYCLCCGWVDVVPCGEEESPSFQSFLSWIAVMFSWPGFNASLVKAIAFGSTDQKLCNSTNTLDHKWPVPPHLSW